MPVPVFQKGEIEFVNRSGERALLSQAAMRCMLSRLLSAEGRQGEGLAVLLAGDAEMRGYNRRFRGKNHATDVLAFPAGEPRFPGERRRLGDLVISLPACRRQAARLGHGRARELAYLLLHGMLHLCGHDHDTGDGAAWARAELRLGRLCHDLLPPGWQDRALGSLGDP